MINSRRKFLEEMESNQGNEEFLENDREPKIEAHIPMMSRAYYMAIVVEKPSIDNGFSFEEEFIELIFINPEMVLYLIVNEVSVHVMSM